MRRFRKEWEQGAMEDLANYLDDFSKRVPDVNKFITELDTYDADNPDMPLYMKTALYHLIGEAEDVDTEYNRLIRSATELRDDIDALLEPLLGGPR